MTRPNIGEADCLKKLEEICEPDARYKDRKVYDLERHEIRLLTIEDFYRNVEELKLHDGVPDDVFIEFEKARNLYLYTWFVYRLGQVAELQAYASLELALRVRHGGGTKKKLQRLLTHAVKHGWIRDEGFSGYREKMKRRQETIDGLSQIIPDYAEKIKPAKPGGYVRMLSAILPKMRNRLAHGSTLLHPGIHNTLEICCEIINQLFEPPKS
ncbi:hypothetical protein GWO43_12280 [candidate division KSB1 bacterium]|nr:hypothetical protein [candidate division KSB1 bacterium]NIR70995.1 hypothetical protein [candidate division KSB1 bacterium]NIS24736.1 hypothetical protein [candidate division KSB1 bacterium]NIT71640.1 hypothetical protein [candidate division KSB1 bacterium]NIU25347.1 hypothetical protein [candidate division KSB1 bacterium]